MAAARQAVHDALDVGARLPDAETGAWEIAGYERFLRYAGNHLHTLMRLGELRNDHTRRLVQRLNMLHETQPASTPPSGSTGSTGSTWLHAATLLGTAHDLLATHLTGVGVPRTPEAEEAVASPHVVDACVQVAEMILTAVDGSGMLLHRTARAQGRHTVKPVPSPTFARLHGSNKAASLYARAALWDLTHHLTEHPPSRPGTGAGIDLGGLRPAVHLEPGSPPPQFATSLAALRLLRHYSHTQADGLTPASPASLRDLALLGARLTDPTTALNATTGTAGTGPTTSLERLHRAHAADQLTAAHRAWDTAADELTRTVQGLTKAPAGYGAAIARLLTDDLTPGLRHAISTALPRMGADAATTITHLAQRGELVSLQRPPLATRHEWRPILPDHATVIADNFTTAANTSRQAFVTLTALQGAAREPETGRQGQTKRLDVERQRRHAPQVHR